MIRLTVDRIHSHLVRNSFSEGRDWKARGNLIALVVGSNFKYEEAILIIEKATSENLIGKSKRRGKG